MKTWRKVAIVGCIGAAALLGGCKFGDTVSNSYSIWSSKASAQKAYPGLSTQQAQVRYANDKLKTMAAALPDDAERQLAAAYFYYGFQHANKRGVEAYCGKMNVDVSLYTRIFLKMHRTEEAAAQRVLAMHGITEEEIWEQQKKRSMAAAKYGLMDVGGHNGSYSICTELRDKPHKYLINRPFGAHFPYALKLMNSAKRVSSVKAR